MSPTLRSWPLSEVSSPPPASPARRSAETLNAVGADLAVLSAATFASTQILAPRVGCLLTWSLGAAAANDFLQAGFAALAAKANELDSETS